MAAFQESEGMLRAARAGFMNTHGPSLVHKAVVHPDSMPTWSHGQAASSTPEESHMLTTSDLGLPDARFPTASSSSARLQPLAGIRPPAMGKLGSGVGAVGRGWGSEDGGGGHGEVRAGVGALDGERTSAPAVLAPRTRPSSATMPKPVLGERPTVLSRPASAGSSRTPAPAALQAPAAVVPAASQKLRTPGVLPQQIAAGRVVEAPWRLAALQHPAQLPAVQGAAGALQGAPTLTAPTVGTTHLQPQALPHNSELLEAIKHGTKPAPVRRDSSLSSSALSASGSHHFTFTAGGSRDGSMSGDMGAMLGLQPRHINVQPRAAATAAAATAVAGHTAALQQQQMQQPCVTSTSASSSQSFPGFGSATGTMNSTPRLGPGVQRANTMGELGQQVAAGLANELWVPSGAVPGLRPSSTGAAGAGSLLDDYAAAHDQQNAHGALPPGPLPPMQPRPPPMAVLGHRPAPRMRALSDSGAPQGGTINLAPLPLPPNSLGQGSNLKHLVLLQPGARHTRTHRYSTPGSRVEEGADDSGSSSGGEGEGEGVPGAGGAGDGRGQGATGDATAANAGAGAASSPTWHSHVSTSLDAHNAMYLESSASPARRPLSATTTATPTDTPAPVTYLRGSWDSDVTSSMDAGPSAAGSAGEDSPAAALRRPVRGASGVGDRPVLPPAGASSGAMGLLRGGDALRSATRTSMRSLPLKALAGGSAGASTATSPPSTTPGSPLTPFSRRL